MPTGRASWLPTKVLRGTIKRRFDSIKPSRVHGGEPAELPRDAVPPRSQEWSSTAGVADVQFISGVGFCSTRQDPPRGRRRNTFGQGFVGSRELSLASRSTKAQSLCPALQMSWSPKVWTVYGTGSSSTNTPSSRSQGSPSGGEFDRHHRRYPNPLRCERQRPRPSPICSHESRGGPSADSGT